MHRGIERRAIFLDTRDREHFLELLGESTERFRIRIHAFCLMDNHYHSILQTPDANLSQAMQWLGLSYSSWFNARHDRAGALFQGRFRSVPVEDGAWALELSYYVHLNPVKTAAFGLNKRRQKVEALGIGPPPSREEVTARLKKLREYGWSSYRAYAGYVSGPDWLTSAEILRRSARTINQRHKTYRAKAQALLSHGIDATQLEKFRDVVGIGSAQFVERLNGLAGAGDRETESRGRLWERRTFGEVLSAVEKVRAEPFTEWLHRHGDWGKWMVLRLAREHTGLTLRQLGEELGGADYAAVSVGLKRFDQRLRDEKNLMRVYRVGTEMLNVET